MQSTLKIILLVSAAALFAAFVASQAAQAGGFARIPLNSALLEDLYDDADTYTIDRREGSLLSDAVDAAREVIDEGDDDDID